MINNLKKISSLGLLVILCTIAGIKCNAVPQNTAFEDQAALKESKIVGGSTISIYDANYQASLRLVSKERSRGYGYGHLCGGSIITQRVILTAAHCVIDGNVDPPTDRRPGEFQVVVGTASLYTKDQNTLQYNVQEIAKHTSFSTETLHNDIALIFINGYIPWTWPSAKAISLNTVQVPENTKCTISGWGKTETNLIPSTLLGASVPIISYAVCSRAYTNIPLSMICAGYMQNGGVDSCQGDSGGPMVCNGKQVGIVSWGVGCGIPNNPGVYTNVSVFQDWIVNTNRTFNYTLYRNSAKALGNCYAVIFLLLITLFGYNLL
uniref:Peptidase S1 domain-containing protein n=1 Tax=Stomoxys calcitrans TaxID=35570 RepID=A0A1I8Q6P5_STOCA|nr:unnamed protein product [Stomoxys calcitrans]